MSLEKLERFALIPLFFALFYSLHYYHGRVLYRRIFVKSARCSQIRHFRGFFRRKKRDCPLALLPRFWFVRSLIRTQASARTLISRRARVKLRPVIFLLSLFPLRFISFDFIFHPFLRPTGKFDERAADERSAGVANCRATLSEARTSVHSHISNSGRNSHGPADR